MAFSPKSSAGTVFENVTGLIDTRFMGAEPNTPKLRQEHEAAVMMSKTPYVKGPLESRHTSSERARPAAREHARRISRSGRARRAATDARGERVTRVNQRHGSSACAGRLTSVTHLSEHSSLSTQSQVGPRAASFRGRPTGGHAFCRCTLVERTSFAPGTRRNHAPGSHDKIRQNAKGPYQHQALTRRDRMVPDRRQREGQAGKGTAHCRPGRRVHRRVQDILGNRGAQSLRLDADERPPSKGFQDEQPDA